MTAAGLLRRIEAVSVLDIVGQIASRHGEDFAELNRKQLHKGLNHDGVLLSPKISDDPYFKSFAAARAYAEKKKREFPDLPYDSPNLFINGFYHSSISVSFTRNAMRFSSDVAFAGSIEAKYKGKHLGLSPDSKREAFSRFIRVELIREYARQTGVKVR